MVEFALIAVLYLVVACGMIDVGLEMLTQEMLDNATRDAARQIRIGACGYTTAPGSCKATSLATILTNVKTLICDEVPLIPGCTTKLQVYVTSAASGQLTGLTPGYGFTGTGHVIPATITAGTMSASPSATSLIGNYDVIIEVGYYRPWFLLFANYLGIPAKVMMLSLLTFQTEPY